MIQPPLTFKPFDAIAVGDRVRFTIRNTGFGQGFTIDIYEAAVTRVTANAVFLEPQRAGVRSHRVTRKEWNQRVLRVSGARERRA